MTIAEAPAAEANGVDLADLKFAGNLGDSLRASEIAWLPSFPATASDEELRHELETKGVVHIWGVMPREYVMDTRGKYFSFMAPTGIIAPGSDPRDGIWVGGDTDPNAFVPPAGAGYLDPEQEQRAKAHIERAWQVVDEQWSKEFCANNFIREMVTRLKPTWTSPFVFTRQIWRTNIPGAKGTSTGVHYDHIFLRHGPPTALTAWVPVGDCAPSMGGLMYLSDSVSLGAEIEAEFSKLSAAKEFSDTEAKYAFNANMDATAMLSLDPAAFAREKGGKSKWLVADYRAGDVVFHHPYMIHTGAENVDTLGRIRLSTDLRYGDRLHEYDVRWDQAPHRPNDGL